MTDELIVDGYSLDLFEAIPVPISFSIADIKDPTKRKQSFSKQVDLPDTMNNNAFFQGAFSMTSTANGINFDATAKATVQLIKRGIKVLDGIMKLNEVNAVNGVIKYNVTILSDNADVFQLLAQVRINEFDWSAYEHTLTRTNIKNSWTASIGTGYYYPLIERGLGRPGNLIFRTIDFVPYVYVYETLQKCFEYIGIEWDSNFLETTLFKSLLIGYGGGDLKSISPAFINQVLVNLDNGDYNFTYPMQLFPGGIQGNNVTLSGIVGSASNPFDDDTFTYTMTQDLLGQWDDGEITIQKSATYQMTVNAVLDYSVNYGTMTFSRIANPELRVFKNGVFWQRIKTSSTYSNTATGTWNLNVGTTFNFNAQSGDVITFRLLIPSAEFSLGTGIAVQPVTVDITTNTPITIDMTCLNTTVSDGDTVDLSVFVPAMRADEFLLSVIRQFNLYVGEIDIDNVVKVEPLMDYYLPTSQFTDITKLVDHGKVIKTKPIANDYEKVLSWKFKEIKDYDAERYLAKWEENYGDYSFQQGSYYSKGEKKTELAWGTIIPYEIAPGILIPRFIKNDAGVIRPQAGPPRIMLRNGSKTGSIVLRDTNDNDSETVTAYPCVHHFDDWQDPDFDLSFKLVNEVFYTASVVTTANCYSEYYSQFITEMTSPAAAMWSLSVKWDEIDVKDRDWRKLLMIDGALFRLNEIKEFSADVQPTTEIELVKVIAAKKRSTVKVTTDRIPPTIPFADPPVTSPGGNIGIDVPVIASPPSNNGKFTKLIRG